PDVIALQEVAARVWYPDNHNFILDYEPAGAMLASLQRGTVVRYRIAYMQIFVRDRRLGPGPTSMGGALRECRGASGIALLYNPNRIRNVLTDVCNVPIPAGLATQVADDVAVARLELALRRNTTFHVYNVHLTWRGSPGYLQSQSAVRSILSSVEPGVQRWIPPLMVGDFNNEQEFVREWLGDFDFLGAAPLDGIIYTLAGNPSHYSSSATVVTHETIQLPSGSTQGGCKDPGRLWSDHCGVLTMLVIREN